MTVWTTPLRTAPNGLHEELGAGNGILNPKMTAALVMASFAFQAHPVVPAASGSDILQIGFEFASELPQDLSQRACVCLPLCQSLLRRLCHDHKL